VAEIASQRHQFMAIAAWTAMNLNIDTMTIDELKDVVKMLLTSSFFEHDRLTALQDRVLKLEMKQFEKTD